MAYARKTTKRKPAASRSRKAAPAKRRTGGKAKVSGLVAYQRAKRAATRTVDSKIADLEKRVKALKREKVKKINEFNRKRRTAAK